jgi:hypothetical protein
LSGTAAILYLLVFYYHEITKFFSQFGDVLVSEFLPRPWNNGILEYWNIGLNNERTDFYDLISTNLINAPKYQSPQGSARQKPIIPFIHHSNIPGTAKHIACIPPVSD